MMDLHQNLNRRVSIFGDGLINKQEEECDNPNELGCNNCKICHGQFILFERLVKNIVRIFKVQINQISYTKFKINVCNVIIIVQLVKTNQIYVHHVREMIASCVNQFLVIIQIIKIKFVSHNVEMELLLMNKNIVVMGIQKMEMIVTLNDEKNYQKTLLINYNFGNQTKMVNLIFTLIIHNIKQYQIFQILKLLLMVCNKRIFNIIYQLTIIPATSNLHFINLFSNIIQFIQLLLLHSNQIDYFWKKQEIKFSIQLQEQIIQTESEKNGRINLKCTIKIQFNFSYINSCFHYIEPL
ncbi:unnamed protein product [Paramecium sonneborni]|uniref:Uncharacterized protein n=1 Tax=Paramecium sonneborni TaxID=65129 RepID=A0A8S1RNR7_9CILI|nr:unnamed protein product [Paramecium sonneborni]